jgi:hypothetical protein
MDNAWLADWCSRRQRIKLNAPARDIHCGTGNRVATTAAFPVVVPITSEVIALDWKGLQNDCVDLTFTLLEPIMKTPFEIATQYLAVWNETNPAKRRALIEAAFCSDASYQDPIMQGAGHQGIDIMIGNAQSQFAGYRFDLACTPDGHNEVVRFSWTLAVPGGEPVARGTDMATMADGRMRSVIGFLDTVVPEAA